MEYSKKQLNSVLSNWGLKGESFKFLEAGWVNYNWLVVANGKKYILRRAITLSPKNFPFEVRYISHLKKAGFPYEMPMAIKTKTGKLFVKYNGKFFWLYSHIEGEIRRREKFHDEDIPQIAKLYASYHNALIKAKLYKKVDDPFARRAVTKAYLESARELKKKKMDVRERYFYNSIKPMLKMYERLDEKAYLKLPSYNLHQDMNPTNILWNGKKIVGLLDFENVSSGAPFVRDFNSLLHMFRDKRCSYKLDLRKCAKALSTYSKYRRPSPGEIRLITDVLIGVMIDDLWFNYWVMVNRPDKVVKLKDFRVSVNAILWYDKDRKLITDTLLKAVGY